MKECKEDYSPYSRQKKLPGKTRIKTVKERICWAREGEWPQGEGGRELYV